MKTINLLAVLAFLLCSCGNDAHIRQFEKMQMKSIESLLIRNEAIVNRICIEYTKNPSRMEKAYNASQLIHDHTLHICQDIAQILEDSTHTSGDIEE